MEEKQGNKPSAESSVASIIASQSGMDGLARYPETHTITSLSRSQIFKLERDGKFPKRVQLSGGAVAWHRRELKAWLDALPRRDLGRKESA